MRFPTLNRPINAVRRFLIQRELDHIGYQLARIQCMREDDDRAERLAYEAQAVLRADLRDLDRPIPAGHDTEQMVD